jgi:hypothetical protein
MKVLIKHITFIELSRSQNIFNFALRVVVECAVMIMLGAAIVWVTSSYKSYLAAGAILGAGYHLWQYARSLSDRCCYQDTIESYKQIEVPDLEEQFKDENQ